MGHWIFSPLSNHIQQNQFSWVFYRPERTFPEGIVYSFLKMFAGALSLERLDGSQLNYHTRWRGELAQTLLKMVVIALTIWQPS